MAQLPVATTAGLRRLVRCHGHKFPTFCTAFDGTGRRLITGSDDYLIKVWCPQTGYLINTLKGHQDVVTDIAVNYENTLLASTSADGTVRIWNVQTGEPRAVLVANPGGRARSTIGVNFSPAAAPEIRFLAATCDDGLCRLYRWDRDRLAVDPAPIEIDARPQRRGGVAAFAFSPTGARLAIATTDGFVGIYSMIAGDGGAGGAGFCPPRLIARVAAHEESITTLVFSADGRMFLTGSTDGTVRVWSSVEAEGAGGLRWESVVIDIKEPVVADYQADQADQADQAGGVAEPDRQSQPQVAAELVADETTAATAAASSSSSSAARPRRVETNQVAWTCDGARVLVTNNVGTVAAFCPRTGREAWRRRGAHGAAEVYVLVPHPRDARIAVSGGYDGRALVWDVARGAVLRELAVGEQLFDGSFSRDGLRLALTSESGAATLFGLGAGWPYAAANAMPEQMFDSDYTATLLDANRFVADQQTQLPAHLVPHSPLMDFDGRVYRAQRGPRFGMAIEMGLDAPRFAREDAGRLAALRAELARAPLLDARAAAAPFEDVRVARPARARRPQGSGPRSRSGAAANGAAGAGAAAAAASAAAADLPDADLLLPIVIPPDDSDDEEYSAGDDDDDDDDDDDEDEDDDVIVDDQHAAIDALDDARDRRSALEILRSRHRSTGAAAPTAAAAAAAAAAGGAASAAPMDMDSDRSAGRTLRSRHRSAAAAAAADSDRSATNGRALRSRSSRRRAADADAAGAEAPAAEETSDDDFQPRPRPRPRPRRVSEVRAVPRTHSRRIASDSDDDDDDDDESSVTSGMAQVAIGPANGRRVIEFTSDSSSEEEEEEEEEQEQDGGAGENGTSSRQAESRPPPPALASSNNNNNNNTSAAVPSQYLPSEWLRATAPSTVPYRPQIGDTVVYFREGHADFWSSPARCMRLSEKLVPYVAAPGLAAAVYGRVVGLQFSVGPPAYCTAKIQLLARQTVEELDREPGPEPELARRTIQVQYHDCDGVPDFLVLYSRYRASLRRELRAGDAVSVLFGDDQAHRAVIAGFRGIKPTSRQANVAKLIARNPWRSIAVEWPDSDARPELVSPWELVHDSDGAAGSTPPLPPLPPAGLDAGTQRRLLGVVARLARTPDFAWFAEDVEYTTEYPDYLLSVAYPMCLATIRARLESGFYRHEAAVAFDVELIQENADLFNDPGTPVPLAAERLVAAFHAQCARALRPATAAAAAPGGSDAEAGPSSAASAAAAAAAAAARRRRSLRLDQASSPRPVATRRSSSLVDPPTAMATRRSSARLDTPATPARKRRLDAPVRRSTRLRLDNSDSDDDDHDSGGHSSAPAAADEEPPSDSDSYGSSYESGGQGDDDDDDLYA